MNLFLLLFKKNIRENNGVDYVLMMILTLLIVFEGINFILLMPYVLRQNINNILWENENEKKYYFQFENHKLLSVVIVKQTTLILGFNIILLSAQLITYLFHYSLANFDLEKILTANIFLFLNLSQANFFFNSNQYKMDISKSILKWMLFQSLNIVVLFSIYISFFYIKNLNLTLLIWSLLVSILYYNSLRFFNRKLVKMK
jgi:hypothetical protein